MSEPAVTLHFIDPQEIPPAAAAACLTAGERERAARFRFPGDADRWSAFRAGLRQILGRETGRTPAAVPLVAGAGGKPALAAPFDGLHFNLSHAETLAVVAVSRAGPVGIDLEPLCRAPDLLECEAVFCHPREIADLPAPPADRAVRLLRIWTAKEAALKAWGTGLGHPPDSLCVRFAGETLELTGRLPAGAAFPALREVRHPALSGHHCTLATAAGADTVKFSH